MENQATELKRVALPNGETLAYREAGNASTVLLLIHGALVSSRPWVEVMPELSKTLRVIAPDIRGQGQSTYNKPAKSHDENAEDIKSFVDALGIKKFFMLGWSMGGGISMKFAANYPEYIQGLILLNSMGVEGVPLFKIGEDGKPTQERIVTEEDALAHPRPNFLGDVIEKNDREKLKFLHGTIYNGRKAPEPERLEIYMDDWSGCRSVRRLAYLANIYNITNQDNPAAKGTNQIGKIKCKVLILHGAKDIIVFQKEAERIKELLGEQAELKIFPEAGHAVQEDYPEEFNNLLINFCADSSA